MNAYGLTLRSGTEGSGGPTPGFAATHAFRSFAQITDRQSSPCSGGSSLPPPHLQLGVESSRAGTWPHTQVSPLEYQCIPRSPQVFPILPNGTLSRLLLRWNRRPLQHLSYILKSVWKVSRVTSTDINVTLSNHMTEVQGGVSGRGRPSSRVDLGCWANRQHHGANSWGARGVGCEGGVG